MLTSKNYCKSVILFFKDKLMSVEVEDCEDADIVEDLKRLKVVRELMYFCGHFEKKASQWPRSV